MKNTTKKNYKRIGTLLGIVLVVGIVGIIGAKLYTNDKSSNQEETQEGEDTKNTNDQSDATQKLPSSTVIVEPEEQTSLNVEFPCEVSGLLIEKIAPYSGVYLEDGMNEQVSDVAMILVHNTHRYMELSFQSANQKPRMEILH